MQITPAALNATFQGFNTLFKGTFDATPTEYQKLCSVRPSSGEAENYAYLAKMPRFRRWVGERVWHNLAAYSQKLVNVDWEDGIELERNHLEDDQLGIYTDAMQLLGMQAKQLWDDAVVEAIQAGDATETYDGQYFFDTDHPIDPSGQVSGTQSNLFTSRALTAANFSYVKTKMRSLKGEDGAPLGIRPNLLVVPPSLEDTAKMILMAETIREDATEGGAVVGAAGVTNIHRNSCELLVWDKLEGEASTWYMLDTRLPVKPFLVQIRRAPVFVALDKPTDPNVVELKKFRYGADARGAAGYGLWQMAAKAVA